LVKLHDRRTQVASLFSFCGLGGNQQALASHNIGDYSFTRLLRLRLISARIQLLDATISCLSEAISDGVNTRSELEASLFTLGELCDFINKVLLPKYSCLAHASTQNNSPQEIANQGKIFPDDIWNLMYYPVSVRH
jgi:hypothetical protein